MPLTIERLRLAIVAVAVLLLLTIAGSFFYGRWRLRHIAQDLPARLGIQIQQTTQGFSLSQSNSQGRTLFTLHAARAVEFKSGGRVSLHTVKIDLYSRQDGVADTIAGDDFEYDPHSQIVRSDGESHIVLHAPAPSKSVGSASQNLGQVVRVTTHGLVFNQKTGVATCSGEVDFQLADSSGQAVGAEYDSKQGHLVLESEVVLNTQMQDGPAVLHASRAVYDRDQEQIHLWQPRYSSGTEGGTAEAATVLLRADGSAERLDAQGGVRLSSTGGMGVSAAAMRVLLDERNQPQQANFSGGVQFTGDQPAQKISGNSHEAEVDFDTEGRADRVILDSQVQCHEVADSGKSLLQRTLNSDRLVLHLLPSKTGNAQLKTADATGNAVFSSQSIVSGHPPQETALAAQVLNAEFAAGNQLQRIFGSGRGTGQTRLKTVAANGDIDTSAGDTLQIEFAPGEPATRVSSPKTSGTNGNNPLAAQSIRTAVQTGHVVLQQMANRKTANGKASAPQISTATATRASYVGASDTLTLTGEPVFQDAQLEMRATQMVVERATGKMVATGAVQTTLRSGDQGAEKQESNGSSGLLNGRQPVHIIAERATVIHATQTAIFAGRARLWQGDDAIEAPVIELSQKTGTLTAYGDSSCTQCVVSNFVGEAAMSAQAGKQKQSNPAVPSTFRILSQRLVYSDAERKASFLHDVQVVSSNGQLLANNAEVFLTPAGQQRAGKRQTEGKNFNPNRNDMAQSSVERIVATGEVRLLQPGRSATGDRLVYTASDGHFVLTGNATRPPVVADADRGTVTGQVLTFASREQAIMVSGTTGHTTTTETRVGKN